MKESITSGEPTEHESSIVSNLPCGTHLCQFYQTKEEKLRTLIPYFKTGLKNNEFCIWVTADHLNEKEIMETMRKSLPKFDSCFRKGQLQIFSYDEWYLKNGIVNPDKILKAWAEKCNQMCSEGYSSMRVSGDLSPLTEKHWANLMIYEAMVNKSIGNSKMTALCTYSIKKFKRSRIMEVVRNHQFTLGGSKDNGLLKIAAEKNPGKKKMSLSGSIIISGYKKLECPTDAEKRVDYFYVDVKVDSATSRIIDFWCPEVDGLNLLKKICQKTLLGMKVKVGIKNTTEEIDKHFSSSLRKNLISVFEEAHKEYDKIIKKDN